MKEKENEALFCELGALLDKIRHEVKINGKTLSTRELTSLAYMGHDTYGKLKGGIMSI